MQKVFLNFITQKCFLTLMTLRHLKSLKFTLFLVLLLCFYYLKQCQCGSLASAITIAKFCMSCFKKSPLKLMLKDFVAVSSPHQVLVMT